MFLLQNHILHLWYKIFDILFFDFIVKIAIFEPKSFKAGESINSRSMTYQGWLINFGKEFCLCQYLLTSKMDFSNTEKYMTFTKRVFICWNILFSYGKKVVG